MKRGDKIRATRVDGTVFEGIATYVRSPTNVEFFGGNVDLFSEEGDYWSSGWTFEVLESGIEVGGVINASRIKELPVGSLVRGNQNNLNGLVASDGLLSVGIAGHGHVVLSFSGLRNDYTVLHINTPED